MPKRDGSTRTVGLQKCPWIRIRRILIVRLVGAFRLFFGIQVIEVSVELVEAVIGRQKIVPIAKVVLAELPVA